MNAELKEILAKLDSARSQIEELGDDLRMLWEDDAIDDDSYDDSKYYLDDCCSLLEKAIESHYV